MKVLVPKRNAGHSTTTDLTTLRKQFGRPVPHDTVASQWQVIRPGKLRKVYGRTTPQRYVLRATQFPVRGEVRELREITASIDKRPLAQLKDQTTEAMQHIAARAASGDKGGITVLVASARAIVAALHTIERLQPEKISAIAMGSPDWPVLLSPNPHDIAHAKDHLVRLRVGEKAPTPRHARQRLDPQNFWTRLASAAFQECRDNRIRVPTLKGHCAGIKPRRKTRNLWKTRTEVSFYAVSLTDCIVIADWEEKCVNLSLPVTQKNLRRWWWVVKRYILEYWHGHPKEYSEALRWIGRTDEPEWRRRNLAIDRVEQSFRSIALQ
jgi:hypothetical protein